MRSKFQRLGKDSAVYGIGGVATRFIGFLLLPLYTRVFSPADYGIMDLIATMTALAGIVLTAGTETALSYYFFQHNGTSERQKTVTSTAVYLVVINTMVATTVWLAAEQIARLTFGDLSSSAYLRLAVLSVPFSSLLGLNRNVLRLIRRPWIYVMLSIAQLLATALLNIYLVAILRIGVIGVFWTNLLVSASLAVWSTILNQEWYSFRAVDWRRLTQIIRYGSPLVIGGLSMWSINFLDRYFLLHFADIEDVGLYSVGVRLASAVGFVTWAFRLANAPFQFEVSTDPDARTIYSRTLNYYMLVMTTLCVLLALFARPILRIMTTDAYVSAYLVVGLMAFSAAAYGLYQVIGVGLLITGKTGFSGIAIAIGAILNFGLLCVFVPWLGMVGAGLATLLTHAAVVIILYRGAQRAYSIPYELGYAIRILISAAIVVLVGTLVVADNLWIDVFVASSLFVSFSVSLVVFGAISPELRRVLLTKLSGALRPSVHT